MMIHPATVHFAIVLPVVASFFGLFYLFTRNQEMSKYASRATVLAAIAMIVAWYTGNQAGPEVYDYLSEAGQNELLEHKELGLYLAIAMAIIAFIQILGCKIQKFALEAFAILLLLAGTLLTFVQGKDGGEIVYNYGMPFKAQMIEETLSEAVSSAAEAETENEKIEIYKEAIDSVKMISNDVNKIYGNPEKIEEEEK